MSIEILTGVPGSGKTYHAVSRIHKQLSSESRFLILHNIEGLYPSDNRCISKDWQTGDFSAPVMADYLRQLRTEYELTSEDPIFMFIDEAQRFFPPELKDQQVLYFFDYHRHFGVNIVLITQHEKKLTYKITTLAEVEIRAVNSRINPFGSFVYKLSSGGEQYGTERLSKDPSVFRLYKSFQAGTGKVKKSRFRYIALSLVVAAPIAWLLFFRVFAESFGLTDSESPKQAIASPPPAPDPQPLHLTRRQPEPPPIATVSREPDQPPQPSYHGPEIMEYSASRDAVLIPVSDTGLDGWLSVSEFISRFPPQLYGYGYFHAPHKRFVLLSATNQELIFPVQNPLFVRTFIRSEPPLSAPSRPEFPVEFWDKSNLPDRHGYTRTDHERIFLRQRGFSHEIDQPAVAPPSPGEATQPGAQAGAAPPPHPQF